MSRVAYRNISNSFSIFFEKILYIFLNTNTNFVTKKYSYSTFIIISPYPTTNLLTLFHIFLPTLLFPTVLIISLYPFYHFLHFPTFLIMSSFHSGRYCEFEKLGGTGDSYGKYGRYRQIGNVKKQKR